MIIEIPDENSVIKWKNNEKDEWKSAEISDLINVYEERPQGELIGREALRATIIEPLNVNDACKNDWYEGYYTAKNEDVIAIDDAPTVPLPDFKEGYKQAIIDGKTNFSRSKGEWIIKPKENSQSALLICNKCKHFIPITVDKNFCPNCGADMRGKEE